MNSIRNKNIALKPSEVRATKWLSLMLVVIWVFVGIHYYDKNTPPILLVFIVAPFFIPIYAILIVLAMRLTTKFRFNK